ncbi:hypothetical protein Cpap_4022 [Ruminiclostridium papyrosolvens DSM 2782]|uniref:Uncharacterized protein n=1 Tax=Ruminiclostridium papyrosolvens DSM 2782 TaxID=588581 RepID=F1T7Y6_9FIRM|nr:hypothetical protein [Ruminiclostridium papyrosolvens]EGD49584.1 hypothetical protein Cpap_4022 [Ruminiclostridium papyrosolvens DSM 2782]WES33290.1 hypothetical protein P0092_16190 [Ruminiclostridium papyrosolvens DSM 2782]
MHECLFCKGNSVEKLPNSTTKDGIIRDYRNEIEMRASSNYYCPDTYLCLDCGYLMKKLSKDVLEKYKVDMKFFID